MLFDQLAKNTQARFLKKSLPPIRKCCKISFYPRKKTTITLFTVALYEFRMLWSIVELSARYCLPDISYQISSITSKRLALI